MLKKPISNPSNSNNPSDSEQQLKDQLAILKKLIASGGSITLTQTVGPKVRLDSISTEVTIEGELKAKTLITPAEGAGSPRIVEEKTVVKGSDIQVNSKVGYAKGPALFDLSSDAKSEIPPNLPTPEHLNQILGLNKKLVISVEKDEVGSVKVLLNPDEPRGGLEAFIRGKLLADIPHVTFFGFPTFHSRPPSFGFTLDSSQYSKFMDKITEFSGSRAKTPGMSKP